MDESLPYSHEHIGTQLNAAALSLSRLALRGVRDCNYHLNRTAMQVGTEKQLRYLSQAVHDIATMNCKTEIKI